MNNEILAKYVGKKCAINTLGQYIVGKIISLNGNWMEIETETKKKANTVVVNVEFIEKISAEE